MLPFKKGAFHLAVEAQVPIVPIVISHYSSHLYSFRQRRFNAGDIYIQALDPIETSQYKMGDDLQPLIDSTHRIMSAALLDLDKLRKQE